MKELIPLALPKNRGRSLGQRGIAAVEMALILPLMIIMAFVIIDFGALIEARLIVANLAREGGVLPRATCFRPAASSPCFRMGQAL